MPWNPLLDAAADLFLGGVCGGCARPGRLLCGACRVELATAPVLPISRGELPGFPLAFGRGAYEGILRELIVACKERGSLALVAPLGDALAASLARLCVSTGAGSDCVVVPVPSGPRRVRERGFDLTGMLARRAVRRLGAAGLSLRVEHSLRQRAGVLDQSGLGAEQRRLNLSRGLALREPGPSADVVLIDDIVTTGSTLASAGIVVSQAGHRVIGAAALADTPKRR